MSKTIKTAAKSKAMNTKSDVVAIDPFNEVDAINAMAAKEKAKGKAATTAKQKAAGKKAMADMSKSLDTKKLGEVVANLTAATDDLKTARTKMKAEVKAAKADAKAARAGKPEAAKPASKAPKFAPIGKPAAPAPIAKLPTLREAAQAVLDASDAERNAAMQTLRETLARLPVAGDKGDTKAALVLNLMRRPEGASSSEMAEATGWSAHSCRGFIYHTRKKGLAVVTEGGKFFLKD